MSKSRSLARRNAVQAIYQWQLTAQDIADVESQFLSEHDMRKVDVPYFRELVREVPLHLHELDDHILPHVSRSMDEIDPVERAILRLACYELEFRLDVPYRAVMNEAIELAKTFGAEHGHKFVNGVLDKVALKLRKMEIEAKKKT